MRSLSRGWYLLVFAIALVSNILHYYWSGFGGPEPRIFRGLHLLLLLPIVFILYPATKKSPKSRPSWVDLLAVIVSIAAISYTLFEVRRLNLRFFTIDDVYPHEAILGWLLAILVIEAVRRSISRWFAVTVGSVIFYLLTCQYWPWLFHFKAFTLDRAAEILYLGNDNGIFGFLTGISVELLYVYILFAAVMTLSGAGDFLIEFAVWLAGWARGGAAKVSVISSALYGTVSGSSVANVYATGSFSIPLMKRSGYLPKQAAAIEAVSGVGGQIMPPIMGAGAFIMAELTGVPYFTIIKIAALPAALYYLGVFAMVHFIALKNGIAPIPGEQRPKARQILRHAYFILPFPLIVALLAYGYSPSKAAFHTTWVTFLLSFLDRRTWPTLEKVKGTSIQTMVNGALIASVLAGAGMTISILTQTGVALAFSTIVVGASQGSMLFCMFLVFAIVSVLGTGIPTTPSYIIGVSVGALALGEYKVSVIAAHLFVFYYAVLADLTPPDALTAFAAANLAGSEPMSTGIEAFKLGIAGFLVPFAFVFDPPLLLQGSVFEILIALASVSLVIICLASAIIGYLFAPLALVPRLILFGAAAALTAPGLLFDLIGLGLAAIAFAWSYVTRKLGPSEP